MKKVVFLVILCLCICFIAVGCKDAKEEKNAVVAGTETKETENADAAVTAESNTENKIDDASIDGTIDIDLTEQSSTIVYAEVYNMMVNPDDYLGKTIKIAGQYYSEYWDQTEKYYFYVVISDATACCQQGIEFIWDQGKHKYPDEYPEDNTIVEVTGVFGSYEELGDTYYYLATDDIMVDQ